MKITVICGSSRKQAQSLKVSKYIEAALLEEKVCEESWLYALTDNPMPLWDESVWEAGSAWEARMAPIAEPLQASDAFVVVVPEWHGQAPAALKNFFQLWGAGQLAHKPALLVAISSVDGGAYPIAELRMSSYKNNRLCYIPEQIIVRNVESVLNEDASKNDADADDYFRKRIAYALNVLGGYATALKQVRDSGVTDLSVYKNGM